MSRATRATRSMRANAVAGAAPISDVLRYDLAIRGTVPVGWAMDFGWLGDGRVLVTSHAHPPIVVYPDGSSEVVEFS